MARTMGLRLFPSNLFRLNYKIRQSHDRSQYHPGGLEEGNKLTLLGLWMRRVSLARSHHSTSIKRTPRPPDNGEKEEAIKGAMAM